MLELLPGTWHLLYSTFPMWKKEGIEDVTFNYAAAERRGKMGLTDEVKYSQKGAQKSIRGFDKPHKKDEKAFTWRGDGWLMMASSEWHVEWMSADGSCMMISFDKTLFTPSGVDILCRSKSPSDVDLKAAMDFIKSNSHVTNEARGMVRIP